MSKIVNFIKSIPIYTHNLLLGVISLLSLMLLYSENKRKKLKNKVDTLETDKKLKEIEEKVKDESLNTSIDKFYDQYKNDSKR